MSTLGGDGSAAEAAAWAALESVPDPELGVSLVGLGLIRGVTVEQRTAHVALTFTTMGCPWTDVIRAGVRESLLRVDGIDQVEIQETWDHAWTSHDVRADVTLRLHELGIEMR